MVKGEQRNDSTTQRLFLNPDRQDKCVNDVIYLPKKRRK
jgi:hypothetical protein